MLSAKNSTRPRRRYGVRAQSTAIAAGVAAVALILGGVVMLLMLHKANNESMYQAAAPRAEQIAGSITAGGVSAIDPSDLRAGDGVDITQVLDQQGNVVAASPGAPHQPIVNVRPGPGEYRYLDNVSVPGLPDKYCAVIPPRTASGITPLSHSCARAACGTASSRPASSCSSNFR